LVYNVERADQHDIEQPLGQAPLKAEWRPDLLDGVMAITGTWQDGSPMLAIPNFARMNRVSQVAAVGAGDVDYAPGTTGGTADAPRRAWSRDLNSQVGLKDRV